LPLRRRAPKVRGSRLRGGPVGKTVTASGALVTAAGMSARGVVSTSATSVEERVEYLLRRDEVVQEKLDLLEHLIRAVRTEVGQGLADAAQTMEAHVAEEIQRAHRQHLPVRGAGIVSFVSGLALTTAANLI
jgi:hypothetical protein